MDTRIMANYLIGFIIAALLFPVLLPTAIEMVTYDRNFYKVQYERLNTAQNIGMSNEDLQRVTSELMDYIRDKQDSMDQIEAEINGEYRQVFNERETAHMVDVKELFQLGTRVRNYSILGILMFAALLYFISNKKPLLYFATSYLTAATLLLILLVIVIPVIQSNFTYYWDQFHYLFFDNDLWILNPQTDIMILMVPESFFNQAVLRVIAYFGSGCLLIGIVSFWIIRSKRRTVHII